MTLSDDEGKTVLHHALENGQQILAHDLLLHGFSVDPHAADKLGKTILHLASEQGEIPTVISLVKHLIEHRKLDPNAEDASGKTALHYAYGSLPIVTYFVGEVGMDPNVKDDLGKTVLGYAAESYDGIRVVQYLLLKSNADVLMQNGWKVIRRNEVKCILRLAELKRRNEANDSKFNMEIKKDLVRLILRYELYQLVM